ncbi:protein PFC0760c [Halyomorpha halys]|uniref:protein PFC0760c n=1 Tax=Halyomorpha halys TaxID=286706 RepID=UPI0006D4DD16|nr:uncharacterized protein LOC106679173 [Halyomorpha halys]XP_014273659.1 uncharacterized protein LOC106679173 [Halyomorpha halys]
MAKISVVIDTNVWGDLENVLGRFNTKTKKSYKEVWDALSDDFIKKTLSTDEQERFKGVLSVMKRLIDMKKSSANYEIRVPSYVYNEKGRSVSSKITAPAAAAEGNDTNLKQFMEILDSVPIKTVVDKTVLKKGTDFPEKSIIKTEADIKRIMKNFLKDYKGGTLNHLVDHLRSASQKTKDSMQQRTNVLKSRMDYVNQKKVYWDKRMTEASKVHGFRYKTKTSLFTTLYDRIRKYGDVNKIQSDPLDVLTDRLVKYEEEFDFFDLQIYLYAKSTKSYIITMNTQAYQEINDTCFLGYFENVKIMHPLINFNKLEDFNKSGDLNDIIIRWLKDEFEDVDLGICRELDVKLTKPVLENNARKVFKPAGENIFTLGDVLKALRIQNKKLQISNESFFGFDNKNPFQFLQVIDEFFNNQVSSNDFVEDLDNNNKKKINIERNKLINKLKSNVKLYDIMQTVDSNFGKYLNKFLELYMQLKTNNKIDGYSDDASFLAVNFERYFSKPEIKKELQSIPRPKPKRDNSIVRSLRKREAADLLKLEPMEKFNKNNLLKTEPLAIKINSHKLLKAIKDPLERKQLIEFADQVQNSAVSRNSKVAFNDNVMTFVSDQDNIKKESAVEPQFPARGIFQTVIQALSNICNKSLDRVHDRFKHVVSHTPKIDLPNGHKLLGSKPNTASSIENKVAYTDVNSTLLLLDTLVRKLNDSKYKPQIEDYLLSPHEQLEKKMAELTTKLGLDPDDIAGNLEKQHQRILDNISEE